MHVVRLLAPQLENESHTKDVDFCPASIRIALGRRLRRNRPRARAAAWIGEFDPLEGVILHEPEPGAEPAAEIRAGRAGGDPSAKADAAQACRRVGEGAMGACTERSALQLVAAGFAFLLAVLWLDIVLGEIPYEPISRISRRR